MNCLCALLCHDDDNVLISHIRVVLKGHYHATPNVLMTINIQGVSILWTNIGFYFYEMIERHLKKWTLV